VTRPSSQDDVSIIAANCAKAQTTNAQAEGFGELGLLETLCPFQFFYGDGVELLGAESVGRVCAGSAPSGMSYCLMLSVVPLAHDMFREVLDHSVTVPDWSETQSPSGSMRTIWSMASMSTRSGSAMSGSHSTTFLPPMEHV
jgi:hypothetical protein